MSLQYSEIKQRTNRFDKAIMPRTNDSTAPRSPWLILFSSTLHFNKSMHTKNKNHCMDVITPLRGIRDHFVAASSSIAVPPDTVRGGGPMLPGNFWSLTEYREVVEYCNILYIGHHIYTQKTHMSLKRYSHEDSKHATYASPPYQLSQSVSQ